MWQCQFIGLDICLREPQKKCPFHKKYSDSTVFGFPSLFYSHFTHVESYFNHFPPKFTHHPCFIHFTHFRHISCIFHPHFNPIPLISLTFYLYFSHIPLICPLFFPYSCPSISIFTPYSSHFNHFTHIILIFHLYSTNFTYISSEMRNNH